MRSVPLHVSCPGPALCLVCFFFWGGGAARSRFPPTWLGASCSLWGGSARLGRSSAGEWGSGGGRPVRRSPRTCGWGGQSGGLSPCLGPSLCLPWAGNKAGVLGVALAMEGVAPIPLWFVLACCPRASSVWRPGVVAWVRLSIVVPAGAGGWGVGAGPAPASLPGATVLPGGGGIIPSVSGGVGAGAPVACGPMGGVEGQGGGSRRGSPPPWGGRPAALCPVPLSSPAHPPQVYELGQGRGAAPDDGCGLPPAGGGGGSGGP